MTSRKKLVVLMFSTMVILTGIVSAVYLLKSGPNGESSISSVQNLPAGCEKPAGGYLIIAGINGFNDSIPHGAPSNPWPIINVHNGTEVNMTVCNADTQAHGFQITHYFDSKIETVAPGQVITVSFVADKTGTFTMYCSIFCTVHIFMQSGELRVGP